MKALVRRLEPFVRLGGWIYVIAAALVTAVTWVVTIQLAVGANASSVRELREQIRPIDRIRQDVRWIKKRLGGPDD